MKSKRGIAQALLLVLIPIIPWILGIILFGVPIFATWFKLMFSKPSAGISPIWIIVIAFIIIILIRGRKKNEQ